MKREDLKSLVDIPRHTACIGKPNASAFEGFQFDAAICEQI